MERQRMFTPHGAPITNPSLLPVQPPGAMIGRSREVASMQTTLKIGASIFLSGETGMGKTALAAMQASSYMLNNPGGVLWFDVLEDDLDLLAIRVNRAYGESAAPSDYDDSTQQVETAKELLEKHRPLVVLDGIIDLDAARDFVRLCAPTNPVIIINDSTAAGPWTPIELNPLPETDCQALFKAVSELTDSLYEPDIEGLCKFLSGNPFAIDVAARLVTVDDITPAELLSTLPSSTGNDGHLVMMTMVFKRLSPSVQTLLLVLSAMFTGTATIELISEMSSVPVDSALPLMRELVQRGLAAESMVYEQPAFRLHEIAQGYTRRWLDQYQKLNATENRALRALMKYVDRHARNDSAHYARLAAEIANVVSATAFATESGQAGAVRTLIEAISQKAGAFVAQRGFQPELNQMLALSSLLGVPTSVPSSTPPPSIPDSLPDLMPEQTFDSEQVTQPISSTAPMEPITDSTSAFGGFSLDDTDFGEATRETPADSIFDEPGFETQATPLFSEPAGRTPKPDTLPPLDILDSEPPLYLGDTVEAQSTPPEPMPAIEETQSALQSAEDFDLGIFDTTQQNPAFDGESRENVAIDEPPRSVEDTEIPTEHSVPTVQGQIEAARKSGDKATQAKLLYTLGRYYAERNDRLQALGYQREALELYEAIDDPDGMLAALDALSTLTAQVDDAEGAMVYATRGVNLARRFGDKARLGRLLGRLGDVRLALGDTLTAIQTYAEAVEILRTTELWADIGIMMTRLGSAYIEQAMYREAIMMLEQSLVIFHKEQRNDYAGRVLGMIGEAYNGLKQWQKAEGYFTQAAALARDNSDREAEAAHLHRLATLSRLQENQPGAIDFYRKALHVAFVVDDLDLQAEFMYELGALLIEQPETIRRGLQLLRESESLVPRREARQLIGRATKRIDRALSAGMMLPDAVDSTRNFAAEAYKQSL